MNACSRRRPVPLLWSRAGPAERSLPLSAWPAAKICRRPPPPAGATPVRHLPGAKDRLRRRPNKNVGMFYGKRGGWRVVGQAALLAAHFSKRHPAGRRIPMAKAAADTSSSGAPRNLRQRSGFSPVVGGGARSKTREHLFVRDTGVSDRRKDILGVLRRMRVTVADRALLETVAL